jgi:hypothetical protein
MLCHRTAVLHQDVAVGIKCEKIAKRLHGDDGAVDGIVFINHIRRRIFRDSQVQWLKSARSFRSYRK